MSPRLASILRGALCCVLFLFGLCGGGRAIRELLPFPEVATVKAKVEHFAARHDDYDTLFLGSSHIYFQVIPKIFDPLAAEEGLATHSFNAGVAGMRPPEDAYLLDCLLRHPPQHLHWVFIELGRMRTSVDGARAGTYREVYWHDGARLWILLKRALYLEPDGKKSRGMRTIQNLSSQLSDFFDHFSLFLQNETNLGRGSLFLARLTGTDPSPPPQPRDALGADLNGWIPTGEPEVMTDHAREVFESAVAERRIQKQRPDAGDPISQQALENMIAKIEKLGAIPILVIPPTPYKSHFFPTADRAGKSIILDFSDLSRFPELYEVRNRIDVDHLNTAGAEAFTRLLVQTWAAEVKRRPQL